MKLNEYQELSKRTMPYNGEPANQVEFENMLGNYAMGLIGESVELFEACQNNAGRSDMLKELGDVAHYAVGLAKLTNYQLDIILETTDEEPCDLIDSLLVASKNISEAAKKCIYHRHDYENVSEDLYKVFSCINDIADAYGYYLDDVFTTNIDKLKTRYPEQFSVEDSIKRVDVNE